MKQKYIVPKSEHVACIAASMIAISLNNGRYSDNKQAGGWTPTGVTDATSGSQFSHGQSADGTGNRAKESNAWESWDD